MVENEGLERVLKVLKEKFGFERFRNDLQKEAILAAVKGIDRKFICAQCQQFQL